MCKNPIADDLAVVSFSLKCMFSRFYRPHVWQIGIDGAANCNGLLSQLQALGRKNRQQCGQIKGNLLLACHCCTRSRGISCRIAKFCIEILMNFKTDWLHWRIWRNYAHFSQHKVNMDPSPKRLTLTSTSFHLFAVFTVSLMIDPVPVQAAWRAQ